MSQKRRSLNSHVDYHQVLPLLGVTTREGPIPLLTECPLCHGRRLTVFNDTRFGGNWHHCPDCHSKGDMISLAASHWDCSIQLAVRKLVTAGCTIPEERSAPEFVAKYEKQVLGMQENCVKLLDDAREAISEGHVKVNFILQQTGLPADQLKPYWPKRMGRFMGGADRLRVYQTFFKPHDDWHKMKKGARFFKGKGWRDVLTIPFHTLPGQCSGWLFIGRQGRRDTDYAYHIIDGEGSNRPQVESGLCMYDVLDSQTAHRDRFGDRIFVFNDPVHALKLQARHMRESDLPLPVVGTYNAKVKRITRLCELVAHDIWRTRPDKHFTFWGATLTADLFNMAARADGMICISKTPTYLGRKPPHVWLNLIHKNAVHWTASLEHALRTLPEDKAVALLGRLEIAPEQMQSFVATCADDIKQLIDRNKRRVRLVGTARINGKEVIESDEGWYMSVKSEASECISNAIIRIEKVLCTDDPDADVYCNGRILYKGDEYPFQEAMDTIDKNPGVWLRKKLLAAAGKLVVVKRGWNAYLLDIARQFHEPEVIKEDGKFGWKPKDSCFALPQFSIHVGGEVVDDPSHVVDEWAPGKNLGAPATPSKIVPLLRDTPANRLFWASTVCLGANIVAPATGRRISGLGLIGHGALMVGRASARASGCQEFRIGGHKSMDSTRTAHKIEDILQQHNWPLILNLDASAASRRLMSTLFNGDYTRNTIVHMTEPWARLAGTLDAWRFIQDESPIQPGPEISMYGPLVLPLWLKWLCVDKLRLAGCREHIYGVADSMTEMMSRLGDPQVVHEGVRLIDDGSDSETCRAGQLVQLLYSFIEDGAVRFCHAEEAHKYKMPTIIRIAEADRAPGVFLSRTVLDHALLKRNLALADPGKVTDAFKMGNALDCECEYNGDIGWFIIDSWWSNQIERCRSSRRQLTVIGGER